MTEIISHPSDLSGDTIHDSFGESIKTFLVGRTRTSMREALATGLQLNPEQQRNAGSQR